MFYDWESAPKAEFAVIGDPVAHSWSPKMHQAAYDDLQLPYSYQAIRVPLEEFSDALEHLRSLGYIGLNVTTPLKEAAYRWATHIDSSAKDYQALNTLHLQKESGTNTDAPGFLETLQAMGTPKNSRVLLLGAGGSARTLAKALAEEGFELLIFNRTKKRAEVMIQELQIQAQILDTPCMKEVQLVVNATTSSLNESSFYLPWEEAPINCLAYDLMYAKEPTLFLKAAIAAGKKTFDGRHLLVTQGALSLEWWLGLTAPRDIMFEALYY